MKDKEDTNFSVLPTCPTCKDILDCVSPADDKEKPAKGDVAVCLHCGEFLVFVEPPNVRRMEFIEEMNMDDKTLVIIKRVRASVIQRKIKEDIQKGII